jgi:hypothetical protein
MELRIDADDQDCIVFGTTVFLESTVEQRCVDSAKVDGGLWLTVSEVVLGDVKNRLHGFSQQNKTAHDRRAGKRADFVCCTLKGRPVSCRHRGYRDQARRR